MLAKFRFYTAVAAAAMIAGTAAAAQDAPIVKPGAPGQPAQRLTAEQATALASTAYAPADVMFMQGMIVHHQQAVEMAALIADRTSKEEIVSLGGRIDASQKDEMEFMTNWLTDKGEPLRMEGMGHAAHMGMMGMATPEQMKQLAASTGTNFDRLFL